MWLRYIHDEMGLRSAARALHTTEVPAHKFKSIPATQATDCFSCFQISEHEMHLSAHMRNTVQKI